MITANELAAELSLPVGDVLTALTDMGEFTLGPDSRVRDAAADVVRQRLQDGPQPQMADDAKPGGLAADEQLRRLREKLSGTAESARTVDFSAARLCKTRPKERGWRPGDEPLEKVLRVLADQVVRASYVERRRPGVIFPDELALARSRRGEWAKECVERGVLLSDDEIIGWITAFPDQVLRPQDVIRLAAAGLTAEGAKLRLWYGRINEGRPTLLDRIRWGDLSVEQAVGEVAEYQRS